MENTTHCLGYFLRMAYLSKGVSVYMDRGAIRGCHGGYSSFALSTLLDTLMIQVATVSWSMALQDWNMKSS